MGKKSRNCDTADKSTKICMKALFDMKNSNICGSSHNFNVKLATPTNVFIDNSQLYAIVSKQLAG